MDWQQAIAIFIVVLTGGFFVWAGLRRRGRRLPCGSACGCTGTPAPKDSVIYRARKGERPQIISRPS